MTTLPPPQKPVTPSLARIELQRRLDIIAKATTQLRKLQQMMLAKANRGITTRRKNLSRSATKRTTLDYLLDPKALDGMLGELEEAIEECADDLEHDECNEVKTTLNAAAALVNEPVVDQCSTQISVLVF